MSERSKEENDLNRRISSLEDNYETILTLLKSINTRLMGSIDSDKPGLINEVSELRREISELKKEKEEYKAKLGIVEGMAKEAICKDGVCPMSLKYRELDAKIATLNEEITSQNKTLSIYKAIVVAVGATVGWIVINYDSLVTFLTKRH